MHYNSNKYTNKNYYCNLIYQNFPPKRLKNETVLLSSSIRGGAEDDERIGADKSSSLKFRKPFKYGKSCGPRIGV